MSTILEITCGGKVSVQSITHTICRIGSNPSLELCMAGIADHAVTLRIQNGKRSIYNRAKSPITLAGTQVLHDQTLPWIEGQLLQLSDGVRIKLLNDSSNVATQTATRSESQSLRATNDTSVEGDTKTGKKRSRMIIGGFFLVFATILFSSESNVENQAMNKDCALVIKRLLAEEKLPNAGCYQQIRFDLQNAMLQVDDKQRLLFISNVRGVLRSKRSVVNPEVDSQVQRFVQTYF